MKRHLRVVATFALALSLLGSGTVHLELTASFPEPDEVLETAPKEIRVGENAETLAAAVKEPMPEGEYRVPWTAAPADDHSVRGRYSFTIGGARRGPLPAGSR